MTEAEFRMLWDVLLGIARTAQFISIEDVQKLIETTSLADAIGPFLDPTAYLRGGMENVQDQRTLAQGFLAFREAIEKVKARIR